MKKRYIIYLAYIFVVFIICLSSGVLAKYITSDDTEIDFTIGSVLYFNYERSNLYRNEQLTPTTPSVKEDNYGDSYQLLEASNIAPGDSLTYHFYVSNFNTITGEQNIVDGVIYPNTYITLTFPNGESHELSCTILYRTVQNDDSDASAIGVWTNLVEGEYLNLPPTSIEKVKYEFKIMVAVDEQEIATDHEDYMNAVLSIKLFINAASDE